MLFRSQVVKYLRNQFAADTEGKTIKGVGLVHAEGEDLAQKIKEAVYETSGYDDFIIEETTPIVSTHTGPGAIGFMYYFE